MKRIMVIGISAGVGKSTFARKLGEALKIKVYHLDILYWKPYWVEASIDEFAAAQRDILNLEQWIVEGNYSNTIDIRAEYADTIIYLELPLYVCLYRVLKRWLLNRGKTRVDMGEGCNEQMQWKFIKFIFTTYYRRKRDMSIRFQNLQTIGINKTIIRLRSKQEIHAYLQNIMSKRFSEEQ